MSLTIHKWGSGPGNQTQHDLIAKWMDKRGISFQDYAGVPVNGVTAFSDHVPVAVMGLRICEGGLGLIDTFCSDPDVDPETRNTAADELALAIFKMAEELQLIGLLGMSRDQHTITRSLSHGFEVSPQVLFSKRVKGIA